MRICYRSNFDPRPHDFKANSRGENRMEDVESCLGKKKNDYIDVGYNTNGDTEW